MVRPSFVFLFVSCPFVFRVHRLTSRFRHPSALPCRSRRSPGCPCDRLPAAPFPITGYGRHTPPMPLTGAARPRPPSTGGAHHQPWITRVRPASNAYGRHPPNLRLEVTCSGHIRRHPPPAGGFVATAPVTSSYGILRAASSGMHDAVPLTGGGPGHNAHGPHPLAAAVAALAASRRQAPRENAKGKVQRTTVSDVRCTLKNTAI